MGAQEPSTRIPTRLSLPGQCSVSLQGWFDEQQIGTADESLEEAKQLVMDICGPQSSVMVPDDLRQPLPDWAMDQQCLLRFIDRLGLTNADAKWQDAAKDRVEQGETSD